MLLKHHEMPNVENTSMISPVMSNDSTNTPPAIDEASKKRKRTEIQSPAQTTRGSSKKQQLEKKEKEEVKKRKRVEKGKKMNKTRRRQLKEGEKRRAKTTVKPLFLATKSLSPERKTKIREMGFGSLLDFPFEKISGKLPYFVLKKLDTKRMEVSFPSGSKLKITPKKIWEVLGIPMGKNKLEYDTPREYYDELLKAFKAQYNKKFITTTYLSKQIQ
ncbi:hypothetical protein Tco_0431654 [Tanacetum coccineum]